jgi:hypothetical protein
MRCQNKDDCWFPNCECEDEIWAVPIGVQIFCVGAIVFLLGALAGVWFCQWG